jgi:hypothetical protein
MGFKVCPKYTIFQVCPKYTIFRVQSTRNQNFEKSKLKRPKFANEKILCLTFGNSGSFLYAKFLANLLVHFVEV